MSDEQPVSESIPDNHTHVTSGGVTVRHTHRLGDAEYHPVAYRVAHPASDTEPESDDPATGWELPPR